MLLFFGFLMQLVISLLIILYGYATMTNLGFSDTKWYEKILGLSLISLGFCLLYDLSTLFSYVGVDQ